MENEGRQMPEQRSIGSPAPCSGLICRQRQPSGSQHDISQPMLIRFSTVLLPIIGFREAISVTEKTAQARPGKAPRIIRASVWSWLATERTLNPSQKAEPQNLLDTVGAIAATIIASRSARQAGARYRSPLRSGVRVARSDCCARAASGHAAAPPSSAMNSRRRMRRMGSLRGANHLVGHFGAHPHGGWKFLEHLSLQSAKAIIAESRRIG